jgi:hypothetical protein
MNIERLNKADVWLGIRAASEASRVSEGIIRKACRDGAIPFRQVPSNGYGEPDIILFRLADFDRWLAGRLRLVPGRHSKTARMLRMIMDGCSVSAICQELGMKRGAALRAWQRECKRNPKFPVRDPDTDRRAGWAGETPDENSLFILSREQKKSGPWENTVKLPSPSSLLRAIRSYGLSANSRNF